MRAIIFGATGMVGQGVLRECLRDPEITRVVTLGRTPRPEPEGKLRSLTVPDLFDLSVIAAELTNLDACFYCIGVTSLGMTEADYARITHDLTIAVAKQLLAQNPSLSFVFVSGRSADSTANGRVMWARVKGRTENDLFRMPFKSVTVVRPGLIVPRHGIKSRTGWYNAFYTVLRPLLPVVERLAPGYVTTTEQLGRAMIRFAKGGFDHKVVQGRDLSRAGA
ncbi:MAG TPA: NAD-dependent epimerase/dehydratase family protein [Gemmatimonadaceae bacterium]|nr:NAD-dependent epimerase/dehydratase family protein [Gemmatimonadaceae bacterium]